MKPEHPDEARADTRSLHTERSPWLTQGSNPGPSFCKATVLAVPYSNGAMEIILYLKSFFVSIVSSKSYTVSIVEALKQNAFRSSEAKKTKQTKILHQPEYASDYSFHY